MGPVTNTMKTRKLGSSDIEVSVACLGTMTWGNQNTAEEAFEQMDYFVARGGNFLDTAELYAVPPSAERAGLTETIIGDWMKARGNRSSIVLATKVAGPMAANFISAARTDPKNEAAANPSLCRADILAAIEGSLRRLQTDYVDLYQLHWPDRYAPIFGPRRYAHGSERPYVPFEEIVTVMGELLASGKIKAWGLSNETTFGVCRMCETAKKLGVALPISIQNDYSMCERQFDTELAEACAPANYNIGLLPYGVLAGGGLTGKYLDGAMPKDGRHTLYPKFQVRYVCPAVQAAVKKYKVLADKNGMSLTTQAIAWANSRKCMGSVIIGATKMSQLEEVMEAFNVELDQETLDEIDRIHMEDRNPQQTD